MKKSKFYDVYQKSYKLFLKEDAPPIPTDATESEITDNVNPSEPDNSVENPPEDQINTSELPDPNDVIGVKTDLLKMFQDFFNTDQDRQDEFKRNIATKSIDDKNAESIISQMKEYITSEQIPKQSTI